jgi:hypothetical protein
MHLSGIYIFNVTGFSIKLRMTIKKFYSLSLRAIDAAPIRAINNKIANSSKTKT